MTTFKFGHMHVRLSYCRKKGNTLYFRRRIPLDLRDRVGRDFFVRSLETEDPRVAAPLIQKLIRQTDAEWKELRSPTREGTLRAAKEILKERELSPGAPDGAVWAFHDEIAAQESPKPALLEAVKLLHGSREYTLSDCLSEYVAARPDGSDRAIRAFRYLREFLGDDRVLKGVRRIDVNGFVQCLLQKGMTTSSATRYLAPIKAAFGRAIRENELKIENVFTRVEIPENGLDVQKREVYSERERQELLNEIDKVPLDQLRSILTVAVETGMRLAEIVGLAKEDLKLDAQVPHIALSPHPWRSLKTPGSTRLVPLTERARAALRPYASTTHTYPAYSDPEGTKSDTASAALVKWIRSREPFKGTKLGVHSLRHAMADHLRLTGCPEGAKDQVLGHVTPGMGARYGEGYPLDQLLEWMK